MSSAAVNADDAACIDAERAYATGCSNGGGMAYLLACDAADVIAAVAPVDFDCTTGPTSTPSCANCAPARPISVIQFRGTADFAVPAQLDMCTGSLQQDPQQRACKTYSECGAGAKGTLCTAQNGSHCGSYNSPGIANLAWEAFQQTALP